MKVIDFFCGSGGFSEGFRQADFEVIWAVDKWLPAVETHRENHPESKTIMDDVIRISNLPDIEFEKLVPDSEIIIGSPPCIAFSNSNKSGKGDKTKGIELFEAFLRIIFRKKYKKNSTLKYWILENVPGAKLAAKAGGAIASGAKKAAGGVKNAWNWAWGNDKEEEEENVEKKKSIQDLTKTKVPSTQNKIDDIEKEKALMLAKEKKDVADLNKKSSEQLEKANKLIKEQTKEGKEGTKSMVNVISSTSNQQNIQPDEIKDEIESFGLLIGNKGMS